jgi:chromosome segregation ATPase
MPERFRINSLWILLATALAVVGATLIDYQLREKQQRVEVVQTELKRTSARVSELEQHAACLSFEREEAVRQRFNLQDKLDGAHSAMRELQSRLNQSTSEINDLKNEAVKTRSEIEDKQSRLDALQSEVDILKQTLAEAYTQIKHATAERKALLDEQP